LQYYSLGTQVRNAMTPSEKATKHFREGYNCSQAVLSAFCDRLGIDPIAAQSMAAGFGGGFGRSQLTCGAISGAVMVLGAYYFDVNDREASKKVTYEKVREFVSRFAELNGSTECLRLIGINLSSPEGHKFAVENNLFTTRCEKYVRDSVAILETMMPAGSAGVPPA
jgi:C_GCAxxG_C_C family probable redox protein